MVAVFFYADACAWHERPLREDLHDFLGDFVVGDDAGAKFTVFRDNGLYVRREGGGVDGGEVIDFAGCDGEGDVNGVVGDL